MSKISNGCYEWLQLGRRALGEFRFAGSEVSCAAIPVPGDVIFSRRPDSSDGFIELYGRDQVLNDFMRKADWSQAS